METFKDPLNLGNIEKNLANIKVSRGWLTLDEQLILRLVKELRDERCPAPMPTAKPTNDPVNHPAHYTAGKVECIDAIEAATIGLSGGLAYCTGAALKYLWRWSRKGGIEDLKKARWYIDRLIDGEAERL